MYTPAFALFITTLSTVSAQYSATYLPDTAPDTSEQGQSGTNKCGTTSSQNSMCQNVYINGVDDFCLWAPPTAGAESTIGDTERIEVSWCLKDGYGTRIIPSGAITGAHFVQTPDFIQVTGSGDLTKLNIPSGDAGGELDPHGADGNGNPIGGLVFSTAFGKLEQVFEWTNFMSADQFCFRACNPAGSMAPTWCQHIYDVMGCEWNMPGNYDAGEFESCQGDSGQPMGVYGTSTFHQGDASTPAAHSIPLSSQCTTVSAIGGGSAILTGVSATTTATSSGTTITGTSISSSPTSTGTGAKSSGSGASGHSSNLETTTRSSSSGSASTASLPIGSATTSSGSTTNEGVVARWQPRIGIAVAIVGGLAML
ncbi:uncharacterized protein BT62DRAFT_983444 [Guyanagaster necrorhizus]|uniref:Macrofage activating glycoprotein n=1 Tax=Guyanagaster necrorhizus TaxID=856835 RepID=A0A9P7VF20_9AGAR|nr:uncharacterized protein BT62DRAFT_983444 [Guyanagaster necrorhizus MCA 3950]KAG7439360.1 hypothetical protein BT62DRAFT_983444 [Guyanagaster necrorhizus MCA 3950]